MAEPTGTPNVEEGASVETAQDDAGEHVSEYTTETAAKYPASGKARP